MGKSKRRKLKLMQILLMLRMEEKLKQRWGKGIYVRSRKAAFGKSALDPNV
jgi:hypothetical protein